MPTALDQQSCQPILSLQGAAAGAAVSGTAFIHAPDSLKAPRRDINFLVSVDRSGGITLWNMAVRRAVLTVSYEVLIAEFIVRHHPPPPSSDRQDEGIARGSEDVDDTERTANHIEGRRAPDDFGAGLALQRMRTQNVPGLLTVLDVTSQLVFPSEVDDALDGLSDVPHHPVALVVQGRNQLAALVMLYPATSSQQSDASSLSPPMHAAVECVVNVPQFGFCKCCIVPAPSSPPQSDSESSGDHVVFLGVPGESPNNNNIGGAFALIYQIERYRVCDAEGVVASSSIVCRPLPRRVPLVDSSVRCGQIMSMTFQRVKRNTAATPNADGQYDDDLTMSVVATESGHAVVSLYQWSQLLIQQQQHQHQSHTIAAVTTSTALPSAGVPRSLSLLQCFVLRSCAESLMHARFLMMPPDDATTSTSGGDGDGDGDGALTVVAAPLLFCVSAEGHMQGYRCDDFTLDAISRRGGGGGAVVPRWPLIWEHTVDKGVGSLEVVVVSKTTPQFEARPEVVVLTGGWDGTAALLDGRTGGVITALHYHTASMSSITVASLNAADEKGDLLHALHVPRFARAARSSRLGGREGSNNAVGCGRPSRRSNALSSSSSAANGHDDLVFITSAEDGGVAAWRLSI
jgi:hypothetical protein